MWESDDKEFEVLAAAHADGSLSKEGMARLEQLVAGNMERERALEDFDRVRWGLKHLRAEIESERWQCERIEGAGEPGEDGDPVFLRLVASSSAAEERLRGDWEATRRMDGPPRRNLWIPYLFAAAAVAAVCLFFVLRGGEPGLIRGQPGPERLGGLTPLIVSSTELDRSSPSVSWRPAPGAATYEVRLLDTRSSILFQSPALGASTLRCDLDPATLEAFPPGTELTLHVTARSAAGDLVATTGPLAVRLR